MSCTHLRPHRPAVVLSVLAVLLAAACARVPRPEVRPAPPKAQAAESPRQAAPSPPPDPVETLIQAAERRFEEGDRQLRLGHLDQARAEFDRAVDLLLESPAGVRRHPRLADYFERLLDRISARELTALAEGDGFTEKRYEPAGLDRLLDLTTFLQPTPEPETRESVKADLERTEHDIPIPLNERVLGYVELFRGRLRDWIAEGLQRGTRYLPMIQSVFRAEGLPLDLAYVPLIESAFKPNALSRARAKGVWQFMRGTALEHGLRSDWYIDERSDPEKATRAAARYLKSLVAMFDGDWHLALASYNAGPGRVQRALRRSGAGDFWELTRSSRYLPRETREYVPMILAAIIIARNPAQYGLTLIPEPPLTYESVKVPRALDLRRVAEWTNTSIDEIQALNPELRRLMTPIRQEYELKVPVGTAELVRARLAVAAAEELSGAKWYTVKRGESLSTIARRLGVSRTDLAEANHLTLRSRVRAGQKLVIPRSPTAALAAARRRAGAEPAV
ncbi:MAG TPA: transglycosylase SLT domain-containing protein, partial [Thermodesulfobacteriota bacterium]|nr:transglycosylase SLT domain-containing protein [Thermodesulfobacteriota bacterium]